MVIIVRDNATLISGLGPFGLEEIEMRGSAFDANMVHKLLKDHYGRYLLPQNLYYIAKNGKKTRVLRRNTFTNLDLVTATIKSIFEMYSIDYTTINITNIWNDLESPVKKSKIVCLSTTFMWNDELLEQAIE